ncbi:MAG: leucine--tRNA ligase [Bacteroidota bacterium]
MEYTPGNIEVKWRKQWVDSKLYQVDNESDRPKYYVLDMFPYPSGAGLHVGHPLGYIASDIYSRYKRLKGFNVLHPMGFDAFGLPAEQYALDTGIHPAVSTDNNITRYKEQLNNLGFSFDWSREVKTCDPDYYKWTQWIFTQLFEHYYDLAADKALPISDLVTEFEQNGNAEIQAATTQTEIFSAADWKGMSEKEQRDILMNHRLAYREIGYVNWCEELGTVLANDQVKDGVSERGGHPVVQKAMPQWNLRITAYAERMLDDLNDIDWSNALKTMQRNWIGRSEGAQLFFDIEDRDAQIEIYTTRPDTIFGATYMVLAPEHELVEQLTTEGQRKDIDDYLAYVQSRSEIDRMSDKQVTGAFTGAYAINTFTQKRVPIWIAEYVLIGYGTGAIMAVPSDDERDQRFATKFGLEIIPVVDKSDYPGATLDDKIGKIINSDFLNGMEVKAAIKAITERIEEMGIGRKQINYKLRDAGFSRQRYWGEPFPIVYDENDFAHAVELEDLPVVLPETDDFKPGKGGKSPLSRLEDWVTTENGYTRETDTMPAVAGSSWYYLRYMNPHNTESFASPQAINYWQDVDLYVGGAEHAVAHLMYARFWHKFLYDLGKVPTKEPFKKLINQGMIQGVIEFAYYHKSSGKFISEDIIDQYDVNELAQMPVHIDFVTDYGSEESYLSEEGIEQFKNWRPEYKNAEFVTAADSDRFLTKSEVGKMSKSKFNVINPDEVVETYGADVFRMYEMFLGPIEASKPWDIQGITGVSKFIRRFWDLFFKNGNLHLSDAKPTKAELKILHATIKKVGEDIERFSFNTCVSAFMEATNELRKLKCNKASILRPMVILLAPFAPYTTEELWQLMGENESVHKATFPAYNEAYLKEDEIEYPISINGKKRATAVFATDASKDAIEKAALELESIQKWLEGKTVRKVIVVPRRMVNIVVG